VISLEGIFGPVVTPFDAAGDIDGDAFVQNVRAHMAAGLQGIVVTGSTGEAALLDESERTRLVELARAAVPEDRALIVGTGAESTRAVIERNRMVAERGADAVLVVAPHYYGDAMTPDTLREHYLRIADASPIPVMLYTIPKYMHFALPPEVALTLAQHENIVGMKDSSGDAALFTRYLEAQSDSFRVLTGSGTLFAEALRLGARGAILAVALFAPATATDVWRAHREGNGGGPGAAAAQARLGHLASRVVAGLGVPGVKAALDAVGLRGGLPRPPLRPLAGPVLASVRELVQPAEPAATR
jgi:4-hydroxy-2-oxoglutarate aldolase